MEILIALALTIVLLPLIAAAGVALFWIVFGALAVVLRLLRFNL